MVQIVCGLKKESAALWCCFFGQLFPEIADKNSQMCKTIVTSGLYYWSGAVLGQLQPDHPQWGPLSRMHELSKPNRTLIEDQPSQLKGLVEGTLGNARFTDLYAEFRESALAVLVTLDGIVGDRSIQELRLLNARASRWRNTVPKIPSANPESAASMNLPSLEVARRIVRHRMALAERENQIVIARQETIDTEGETYPGEREALSAARRRIAAEFQDLRQSNPEFTGRLGLTWIEKQIRRDEERRLEEKRKGATQRVALAAIQRRSAPPPSERLAQIIPDLLGLQAFPQGVSTPDRGTSPQMTDAQRRRRCEMILETVFGPRELEILLWYSLPSRSNDGLQFPRDLKSYGQRADLVTYLLPFYTKVQERLSLPLDHFLGAIREIRALLAGISPTALPNYYGVNVDESPFFQLSDRARLVAALMDHQALYTFARNQGGEEGDSSFIIYPSREFPTLHKERIVSAVLEQVQNQLDRILTRHKITAIDLVTAIDLLQAPLSQKGTMGGGIDQPLKCWPELKDRLRWMIQQRCQQQEYRLKVLLAGTLYGEVSNISFLLDQVLGEEYASAQSATPYGDWLQKWKIEIVGYSIHTGFLAEVQHAITQGRIPPYYHPCIRLEYIDLLDPEEWPRIAREGPDMILASSSLYVTQSYNRWKDNPDEAHLWVDEKFAMSLWYTEFAMNLLPIGGLFVTEGGFKHVIPHPEEMEPILIGHGLFSGLFVRTG